MNPPALYSFSLVRLADGLGATASFLCAIHCALLPFILVLLPSVGLTVLADHDIERIFIACASGLSLMTLVLGFQQHRRRRAFAFLLPGLALLWLGALLESGIGLSWHAVFVSIGGTLLTTAHLSNLRLTRGHVHDSQCRH